MPKAQPAPTPLTRPYWDGLAEGVLRIQRCIECSKWNFYPRLVCPACGHRALQWHEASGRATLYSYVISHTPAPGFEDDLPLVIAVVELAEGPRMMTNLVDVPADPRALQVDMDLQLRIRVRDGIALPFFAPLVGELR